MSETANQKYHITDDGKVYHINEDGSCSELGNIANIQNKTSPKSKKINGWSIISVLLFVALCMLVIALYEAYDENDSLRREIYYSTDALSTEISDLKEQLPQTYYTKYPNQKIYYWAGSFLDTNYTWSNAGTAVTIYMQKDGYGMTEWGWCPMNCLRQ